MSKKVIVAKTVASSGAGNNTSPKQIADDMAARVAYFYPSYTLSEARRLPARDLMLLIKIARQEYAKNYHELTNIMAAPHSKNGSAVNKLINHYREVAKQ